MQLYHKINHTVRGRRELAWPMQRRATSVRRAALNLPGVPGNLKDISAIVGLDSAPEVDTSHLRSVTVCSMWLPKCAHACWYTTCTAQQFHACDNTRSRLAAALPCTPVDPALPPKCATTATVNTGNALQHAHTTDDRRRHIMRACMLPPDPGSISKQPSRLIADHMHACMPRSISRQIRP